MEQVKRRSVNDDDYNHNKRQKLPISTTTTDTDRLITCFEDLSNDLVYEIFDYLDYYDIYQTFFDLNKRFTHLLFESPYPLTLNFSAISKSKDVHHANLITYLNKDRIGLFRITNSFLANYIFKDRSMFNNYSQLKKLILENILSEHVENILISIKYNIPKLSSFTMDIIDEISLPGPIYSKIYSISTLNDCKLTFQSKYDLELFSIYHRELSSIKSFILNTSLHLHDLDLVLSYLPNLHYLSINYLTSPYLKHKKTRSTSLKSLNKLNLKLQWIGFDQFKQVIMDYFSSIEIFYLSVDNDQTYLNARQWEELITNHMTNLKIFDFQYTSVQRTTYSMDNHHLMDGFLSSFWIERQWFFHNQHEQNGDFFYSINPYRRHDYTFDWQRNDHSDQHTYFNKVHELCISGTQKLNHMNKYFPNVTELTFDRNLTLSENSIVTTLNSIVNLSNITKLVIKCDEFSLKQLIELLSVTNHLSSLKVFSLRLDDETELFKKVSNTNMIKTLIIHEICTLEKVQLLMNLFPRLEQFITRMNRKEFLSIMTFLLTKTKYLCFTCVLNAPKVSLKEVKKLIKQMKIINNYEVNYINGKLYLWW